MLTRAHVGPRFRRAPWSAHGVSAHFGYTSTRFAVDSTIEEAQFYQSVYRRRLLF
jgi:hypothetical protein